MSTSENFVRRLCSRRYGYVVLAAGLIGIQNYSFSFLTVMPARNEAFTKEFMKANFEEMHRTNLGLDSVTPSFGYPDMGAGIYSRRLSYADWFRFNCAQRIHANSIEHLVWVLPALLANGLMFPRFTAAMGVVILVGRELYRYGYMSNDGPNSRIREMGAVPLNAAELLLLLGLGLSCARFYFKGFISNRRVVRAFTKSHYDVKLEDVIKASKKKGSQQSTPIRKQ